MAAGRHGGYRENEFRDRETNFHVSRRSFGSARQEFERVKIGNDDRGVHRSLARDVRDKVRVRHQDMKENAIVNGHYHSSSSKSSSGNSDGDISGSDHGPKQNRVSRTIDRETGELSSESGSDDATESGLGVKGSEDSKVGENGNLSPMERKRKISPVVWDRDGSKLSIPSRNRIITTVMGLPRPQKLSRQSPNIISDSNVNTSSVRNSDHENLPSSEFQSPSVSESLASPVLGKRLHQNVEVELLDNEDNGPTRNISFSRWAGGNTSPSDEGEVLDDKETPRQKKIQITAIRETKLHLKTPSDSFSEDGDLKSNGFKSNETRVRSSESNEQGAHCRFLSGDENSGGDVERGDFMEVDERHDTSYASFSPSDTDSDDNNVCATQEPPSPIQRSVNMLQGCRSVDEFERLNKIDEGTYGVVYRARDKKTGEIVALKKVKMEKEREGFPLTALREINILLSFHHPSIIDVKEVVVGNSLDSIFMAMEYMEHDLKGLMETMKHPFSQSEVKCLMIQLLEGVRYLHSNWVLHRDLKTSNLLLNNQGEMKICDFGLARQYGSPLKPYTHLVVTLWYRAPELLLGARQYSTAIDMWSLGCIMAELLSKEPLFNGKTEVDQLDKIFRTLGTPNETIWPGFSKLPGVRVNFVKHQFNLLRKKFPATSFTGSPVLSDSGFDLLNKLLAYDPEKRISAEEALDHEWFREVPLPKSKEFMPTFPAQHAQDRRMRRILRSPDPLEEQRIKELRQQELGTTGLFGTCKMLAKIGAIAVC
ncbi:Cyclin-dependent kinase G-2 [Cucurbita argyrosperma subsp. argyrosperma]|nr:Cyclin-dependent kinase G-2 [Cucurbita argyrosperma subsp. argyrosperma]